jgi:hypothetical protein
VTDALQLLGLAAIVLGFAGTWLAARQPAGWLVNLLSAGLWVAPMLTAHQWAALTNAVISIAICIRNYSVSRAEQSAGAAPAGHPVTAAAPAAS